MNKDEQMRLCLMLAFQSIFRRARTPNQKKPLRELSPSPDLWTSFAISTSNKHSLKRLSELAEDKWATKIDTALNMHVEALQSAKQRICPKIGKHSSSFMTASSNARRAGSSQLFYAEASTEQLADLVLKYLDEEIEDRKAGGYQ